MQTAKAHFLKKDLIPLLKSIPGDTGPRWGKMSVQQMVEHFTDAVRIAAGSMENAPILTPAENIPRMQAFIASDKPLRENTRNPMLPDEPASVRRASKTEALNDLQAALDAFFEAFYEKENTTTRNPLFGDLNFDLNIQLLYKHAVHHLRQFSLLVEEKA